MPLPSKAEGLKSPMPNIRRLAVVPPIEWAIDIDDTRNLDFIVYSQASCAFLFSTSPSEIVSTHQ